MSDLMPPGAAPGTIPTDLEQATGLERLEILGKMQGVDVFDMKPLDASRKGTLSDPIVVKSFGDEQYLGCTGCPADTHVVIWLTCSRDRPIERCPECGSVYKMEYVGPQEDDHHHHDAREFCFLFLLALDFPARCNWRQTDCFQTPTPTAPTTTRASLRPWPISSAPSTDKQVDYTRQASKDGQKPARKQIFCTLGVRRGSSLIGALFVP